MLKAAVEKVVLILVWTLDKRHTWRPALAVQFYELRCSIAAYGTYYANIDQSDIHLFASRGLDAHALLSKYGALFSETRGQLGVVLSSRIVSRAHQRKTKKNNQNQHSMHR